jgi:hypothetical protein
MAGSSHGRDIIVGVASSDPRGLLARVVIVAAIFLLPGCGLIASIGVSGRVVDRETGQPIEGAVVSLQRTAHCASFHAYSRYLPPAETRTDGAGRFSVGSGSTAATAGCLGWAWSRSLRVLAPGYLAELLEHDDPWLKVDPRRQFDSLATAPVALERTRYALELRPLVAVPEPPVPDDPRPGPMWEETLAAIRSAKARPLDSAGVFVRRPGAVFDQIVVVDLLRDRYSRRRAVVLARDRRTGSVHGWTAGGESISLPLPAPDGWSLVGASRRLGVPLLEKGSDLYFPGQLDWAEPLYGLGSRSWSRVATQRGAMRAIAAHRQGWVGVEAAGSAITSYRVVEQAEGKTRLRLTVAPETRLALGDVLPDAQPPIECLANGPGDDSLVMIARTSDGRGVFVLPWPKLARMEWRADRERIPARLLEGEVSACAASPSSLYVSLRDRGIVRSSLFGREGEPLPQGVFLANGRAVLDGSSGARDFVGLATGSLSGGEVLYAVAGDDAVYRFSANGEPDRRLELEVGTATRPTPVR